MRLNGKLIMRMIIMLIAVAILFGIIFFIKHKQKQADKAYQKEHMVQIFVVSAMKVQDASWQQLLKGSGSLRSVEGVNITTQLAGMVRNIYFTPGSYVSKGQLLVLLNIDPDIAKLHSLEAQAKFAKITYFRNKRQYAIGAVSKEQLDSDEANFKNTAAQVAEQKAIIEEKTIRAPFSGQLGIRLIDKGQYLNPGDAIVNLQVIDPIYADFNFPQENLAAISVGQSANVRLDNFPNKTFTAEITTINPAVNPNTRNVVVEITLSNPEHILAPGMFVSGEIIIGAPKNYLTLPIAAIAYNSYGDYVYVLNKTDKTKKGYPIWKATQKVVTTGEIRGNRISILSGIKKGDLVVTSGQLKLQNNSLVVINNKVQPSDNPNPKVTNE